MSENQDTKPKTGRPLADVDGGMVEKLAGIGCTVQEIGAVVGCSPDTINRRFAGELDKGRENGKTRLRKKQTEIALKGNVTMLIWLGKQMLGQSDKLSQEVSGPGGGPIHTHEISAKTEALIEQIAHRRNALTAPRN